MRTMLFRMLLLLLLFCAQGFTQDYFVPSEWREPTSSRPRDERISIAKDLIDTLTYNSTSGLVNNLTYTQSANWHCGLAISAWIIGKQDNAATVKNNLIAVTTNNFDVTLQNNPINWGLAAYYAFRAYNDNAFLNISTTIWDEAYTYFITPKEASSGRHPTKNVSIQSQCRGASTAGGVFYASHKLSDTGVNGATVGGFLALTAYLYEVTSNTTYASAAGLSAEFIMSQLYDGTIIRDGIILVDCGLETLVITDNSGFVIEGLTVYSNVPGNSTMKALANNLTATVIKFNQWTDAAGILHEGQPDPDITQSGDGWGFKSILIRGLFEAWRRSPPNSDVANLIQSYITVQYNALLDFSRTPGGRFYSPVWRPPPAAHLLPWGQLAAIDVMNSAINLPVSNVTVTASSTAMFGTATPSPNTASRVNSWALPSYPLAYMSISDRLSVLGIVVAQFLAVASLLSRI
ncbi:hypothetical protein K474DRAFT_882513 [Panus rudis PR-1116 ss-1]|nr:hypothetical protein K474DRAFT_882513 [Panus rudis PR-1116 ss-1]